MPSSFASTATGTPVPSLAIAPRRRWRWRRASAAPGGRPAAGSPQSLPSAGRRGGRGGRRRAGEHRRPPDEVGRDVEGLGDGLEQDAFQGSLPGLADDQPAEEGLLGGGWRVPSAPRAPPAGRAGARPCQRPQPFQGLVDLGDGEGGLFRGREAGQRAPADPVRRCRSRPARKWASTSTSARSARAAARPAPRPWRCGTRRRHLLGGRDHLGEQHGSFLPAATDSGKGAAVRAAASVTESGGTLGSIAAAPGVGVVRMGWWLRGRGGGGRGPPPQADQPGQGCCTRRPGRRRAR
jgi:hypothetical protein